MGSVAVTSGSRELAVAGVAPLGPSFLSLGSWPGPSLLTTAPDDGSLTWQVVRLTWWAVCRDSVYYTLSVVVLIAVSQSSHPSAGWSGPREGTGARLPVLDPVAGEVAAPRVECVDPPLSVHIGPHTSSLTLRLPL